MPQLPEYRILSVNTAKPRPIGTRHGQVVYSAIDKRPVSAQHMTLHTLGLADDTQADRKVHGGPDKAVYFYPGVHYARWAELLGHELPFGSLGENVTIGDGLTENGVYLDMPLLWDDAVLQVTKYRRPCFKLAMHLGPKVAAEMITTGFCGFYAKVVQTGQVSTHGVIMTTMSERPAGTPTIAEMFSAAMRRDPRIPDLRSA